MHTCQIETVISREGVLTIEGLPFHAGDKVEVIIKNQSSMKNKNSRYSLRGKPIKYTDPFEGVAENDWEVSK